MSRVYDFVSGNSWGVGTDFSYVKPTGGTDTIVVSRFAEASHEHEEIDDALGRIDEFYATDIEATDIEAHMVESYTAKIKSNLIYRDVHYLISDKYHKAGATTDDDEIDTSYKTIVVRDPVNGCRISNLQVRADPGSPFVGDYPGLFFTEGWCTEQLSVIDDGKVYFQDMDAAGTAISGSFAQFGRW